MSDHNKDILLIESSATQRYLLVKLLRGKGFDVVVAESFEEGLSFFTEDNRSSGRHRPAVVLGWPAQTLPVADELLALLESGELRSVPVLLLSHEPDLALKSWVARRPRTAVLEWQNRDSVCETLETLHGAQHLAPVTVPSLPFQEQLIRILLVDDSPSVRTYYRKLLMKHGYHVEVAANVEEGFSKAEKGRFDIAIIDYFMPDANGDVLCRRLQDSENTCDITIAMFTGTYLDQVIKDALDAGATECMFKNEVDALFLARVAAMSRSVRNTTSIDAERQKLQSILHSVGDGVYGVDNEGRVTFINPAAIRILGYDEEANLLGASPSALFHHSDEHGQSLSARACKLQRAYGQSAILQNWETVFWSQSGSMIPVECTVYPMYLDGKQEGSVVAFKDISERKSFEEKLRWQATHDPLTELFNRRYFEEQMEEEFERLTRSNEVSALLYIDLDHFKYINDTASHDAGDQLLIQVGQRLRSRLRSTDTLARLGGDEFAVLLRNVDPQYLEKAADCFRTILSDGCFYYGGSNYSVQGSVGVATFSSNSESPGDVLAQADIACHIAKTAGGNQTQVYVETSDYRSNMGADLGWSARLREAIEKDHFELYFHPIVPVSAIDLNSLPSQSGAIWDQISRDPSRVEVCFEVLLRLKGRESTLINPGAFIPTAERFHLMPDIDFWVLRRAISRLGAFQKSWKAATFSINLAGQTLVKQDLVPLVKELIERYEVNPGSLSFEITETTAIANITAAQRVINELTSFGCHFSLDDFGTGFSSFSHLKHLNVDCVKIDGIFVRGMTNDPTDHAMVISMNDIAHFLGQKTVAEYVETADALRLLADCGVDLVQGFYITQPIAEQVACSQTASVQLPETQARDMPEPVS
jgi:diguanylate cyclase (GGDEF)-like protein/PAS domain S-box-containing protein